MRPRSFLITGFLLLTLSGCGRDRSETGALNFRVDPARLGDRFDRGDLGLTMRAPAGWKKQPDAVLDAAIARLGEAARTGPEMLAFFHDDSGGSSLVVSRYAASLGPAARDSVALLHLRKLRDEHPGGDVQDGRFTYRGWEIVQIRTVDTTMVAFKLLLSRPKQPLVELDYVVPRSVYPRELEAIESSIGSLEPRSQEDRGGSS